MIIPDEQVEIGLKYVSDRWAVGVEGTNWWYECDDVYVEAQATRPLCVDAGNQIYLSLEKTVELGLQACIVMAGSIIHEEYTDEQS